MTEPILSFEEFTEMCGGDSCHGNFTLFFSAGAGYTYRETQVYIKYSGDYPDAAGSLCERVQAHIAAAPPISVYPLPDDILMDMYEAYKAMQKYGFSNDVFFR